MTWGRVPYLRKYDRPFLFLFVWLSRDQVSVRPSVRPYRLWGGRGWKTKKAKGGESRECNLEARMVEFSWRETSVQPAFISLKAD